MANQVKTRQGVDRPFSLVLEDDKNLSHAYQRVLESLGYEAAVCHSVADARLVIRDKAPALILVDIDLPDGNGLDLMDELRNDTRGRFVVISGDKSQRAAIKSIRSRACELLIKPVSLDRLRKVLQPAVSQMSSSLDEADGECWIRLGCHPLLVELRTAISYCTEHGRGHALITGDKGVEKQAVAREIHYRGRRSGGYVVVDCRNTGAIEVFGLEDPHGEHIVHLGAIDEAKAGTLVLDHVESLSLEMQSRLIPLLDSGTFRRVNGRYRLKATLSVIGISRNAPASDEDSPKLRPDFLYRLAKTTLRVPSLNECSSDLEAIAQSLLASLYAVGAVMPTFSEAALHTIRTHHWSGNTEELRDVIKRSAQGAESGKSFDLISLEAVGASVSTELSIAPWVGSTVWEIEKQLVEATLDHCNGDKELAAKTLGMSLKTLYNRINAYR